MNRESTKLSQRGDHCFTSWRPAWRAWWSWSLREGKPWWFWTWHILRKGLLHRVWRRFYPFWRVSCSDRGEAGRCRWFSFRSRSCHGGPWGHGRAWRRSGPQRVIRESSPFALYWIGCCSWVFFCRSLSAPLLACGDEIINIKLKLLICIYAPRRTL